MKSLLLKISILSISLLTVMASAAISPALAKIRQAFPGIDITLVKLVLTLPSLLIIPFSLLGGWLASRMNKKNVLFIGLVIYLLAGVGGGFAQNITQLLIIRGLFGIGVGLIIPLSVSLIADFYEKQERAKMMGLSGSVSHFGGVIFLLLSGWLASISWRYAFAVYGLALAIIVIIALWLPGSGAKGPAVQVKQKLPKVLYVYALLGALMMIAFYAAPTNLAMFIENEKQMYTSVTPLFNNRAELTEYLEQGTISPAVIESFGNNGIKLSSKASFEAVEPLRKWRITDGNRKYLVTKDDDRLVVSMERLARPGMSGYLLSTMTLIGVGSGLILALLLRWLGPYCSVFGIAAMAVGYAFLAYAVSLKEVFFAMVCIGFSSGILMPLLLLEAARITQEQSRAFSMAVVSVGIYLGQFLSPVILKSVSGFGQDIFRSQFTSLFLGLSIATLISLASAVRSARHGGFEQYKTVKVPGH